GGHTEASSKSWTGERADDLTSGPSVEGFEERAVAEGTRDQFVATVAVEIARRERDAAREAGPVRQEIAERARQCIRRAVLDVEVPHPAGGAGSRRDRDLVAVVAVEVSGGHKYSRPHARIEGDKAGQQGRVGDLAVCQRLVRLGAVNDLHLRLTT